MEAYGHQIDARLRLAWLRLSGTSGSRRGELPQLRLQVIEVHCS
jgi:hypothetical protein